jgi:hypothetical protein
VGSRYFKIRSLVAGALVLAFGTLLVAGAAPAQARTIRDGSASVSNRRRTSNIILNGSVLFTWYDIGTPVGANTLTVTPNYGNPEGDNVIRLVDTNGCGNDGISNLVCGNETDLCAMIYAFDDDQEMGECCGCRITPNELESFSVRRQLVNNWDLATQDNSRGTIVVVASAVNDPGDGSTSNGCGNGFNAACDHGCSATEPAVTASDTNLIGSVVHDSLIVGTVGLTETSLFDQGGGEAISNAYLVAECAVLAGNGTHRTGFCTCDDNPTTD